MTHVSVKGRTAEYPDTLRTKYCWHVFEDGEFIYCGLEWQSAIDVALSVKAVAEA